MPPDREVIALADALTRAEQVPSSDASAASPTRGGSDQASTIAVLPFAHLGVDGDDDTQRRWRDGLAEEVIGELSRVLSHRVLGRTASFALGAAPGLAALRAESAITHANEGSVRRKPTSIRVTARLLHVRGGHSIWSERFECPVDDDASAHDIIASSVAERVQRALMAS